MLKMNMKKMKKIIIKKKNFKLMKLFKNNNQTYKNNNQTYKQEDQK